MRNSPVARQNLIGRRPNRRFHGRILALAALAAVLAGTPAALAQLPPIDCYSEMLGTSQFGHYFVVDLFSGAGSSVASMTPGLATELEYDVLFGNLWAEEVNGLPDLHLLDPATGATLATVTHPVGGLTGLEFVGQTLYGTFISSSTASELVIVDTATGDLTTVGPTGFGPISGLAYDPGFGVMYGITAGGQPADLVTLDLSTGAATLIGPTGLDRIGSIELGPDLRLYGGLTDIATSFPRFLVEIDRDTGAATPIGDTGFSITGLTTCADLTPVILPAATDIPTVSGFGLGLLALAVGAAGLRRLRRPG